MKHTFCEEEEEEKNSRESDKLVTSTSEAISRI